jgi:hypothetical protein
MKFVKHTHMDACLDHSPKDVNDLRGNKNPITNVC